MNEMTAECCKNCPNTKEGGCKTNYTDCYKWRRWFREEWEGIRRDAQNIIKKRQEKKS